ncbi:MAG: response regulator [SAR324 cluster bacterium]|nr:response regulator [SAR324 cluster bacterium]
MVHASEKKVLVVDDEPDIRIFVSACLQEAGFSVDDAIDGLDALNKIMGNKPDLITLDLMMPRKSGVALLRNLKKSDEWNDIPIIIITAHASDSFGSKYMRELNALEAHLRPQHIMEKPIIPSKLVSVVSSLLAVETDVTEGDERDSVIDLIKSADQGKLDEIKKLFSK